MLHVADPETAGFGDNVQDHMMESDTQKNGHAYSSLHYTVVEKYDFSQTCFQ